jgi:hypothetical protein
MKINEVFSAANFNDAAKLEWVKEEAEYLLKIMEADPNFALAERFGQSVSPTSLLRFFRQRERCEKACHTLQYLLSFLSHIPTNSEIRDEPVNPAEQFRSFISYQADLLLEEDVKNAVFQATNHTNHVRAGIVWDFQEQIITTNRKLKNMLAKEEENVARSISNQCHVLEFLSLFWFEVRRHDLRCARRSDIFMYLLAQLVRSRCWQVTIA